MIVPDPAKIVVPRRQGEILITPPLDALSTAAGARDLSPLEPRLSEAFGKPFSALQKSQREHFADAIRRHAGAIGDTVPEFKAGAPWIITGHQVEFYHAGVWAKVIAADVLARKTGGIAIDLLVDHDLVEEMGFDVPVKSAEGTWKRQPILFDKPSPLPVESLHAPDAAAAEHWKSQLREQPGAQSDALTEFLKELNPASPGEPYTLWMSRARRHFESAFGLQVAHIPTTQACAGPAWAAFVQAWIHHAAEWTAVYNRHLADYRTRQAIKNPEHPMPDLSRNTALGTFELPFWIYRNGEPRARLVVRPGETPVILFATETIPATPEIFSAGSSLLIRPRALTLTMFVRIFLAEVFIHGIGGALYDQITDGMVRELFGEAAAASYGCVSAAWLLPIADHAENPASAPWLKWQLHHLTHNPQLALGSTHQQYPPAAQALARRRELLELIADSLEIDRRLGREARHQWFDELHAVNRQLHEIVPERLTELLRRLAASEKALHDNKVLLWREWFFALHSLSSLRALVDKISA